ncbi:hypothetical protein E1B28_003435 [Marasmius oreades]|uniref:Uncharacterized protein n=1 Tax=Marasmius oreades TaxID=181124 RepID=A0A9P7RLH7_9AGAR|nr:uncharacterized protein E1B28_003435 [Marasmius oreades]KAG7085901.1 hypothetical protein E1B28_003435 [Marasmius oreades]
MSSHWSRNFGKLSRTSLRVILRDLGVQKWGNLRRDEMLAELGRLFREDETSPVEENEKARATTSKSNEDHSSIRKRKRTQPAATDSEEDSEQADEEDKKQPTKRMRQAAAVPSSRNRRSQDEISTRTTRSKALAASKSITPRTTRASAARNKFPRIRSSRQRGNALKSTTPSSSARTGDTQMDVDETAIPTRILRSHGALSSPVRVTRAREPHRRTPSAASASEAEVDSDGVNDADEEEEAEEEEEGLRASRKKEKGKARVSSIPVPEHIGTASVLHIIYQTVTCC